MMRRAKSLSNMKDDLEFFVIDFNGGNSGQKQWSKIVPNLSQICPKCYFIP